MDYIGSMIVVLLLCVSAMTCCFTIVSMYNYPGGYALQLLHSNLSTLPSLPGLKHNVTIRNVTIHLDVYTCMTGVTRYLLICASLPNVILP